MGATTSKNGRLAAIVPQERPTYDAIYEQLAAELLRRLELDGGETLATALARRFREGSAELCCQAIGTWIEQRLEQFGWTQRELAERIGVDRSAVARWTSGGAISLTHLVLALIELRGEFADLPLPARREMAIEGYLTALSHVHSTLSPSNHAEPIDREQFWCLYHLFSEPYWERAIRNKNREKIRAEVRRVLTRMTESLGHEPRRIRGVDDVRRTVERWATAWIVCLSMLPGGWSIR